MRNVVAGYRLIYVGALGSYLFNDVSFHSYFVTLTPSVNGFAEQPATLVIELSCHVHFKGLFQWYIYIYIYIYK